MHGLHPKEVASRFLTRLHQQAQPVQPIQRECLLSQLLALRLQAPSSTFSIGLRRCFPMFFSSAKVFLGRKGHSRPEMRRPSYEIRLRYQSNSDSPEALHPSHPTALRDLVLKRGPDLRISMPNRSTE
jgi:hypothetical protein